MTFVKEKIMKIRNASIFILTLLIMVGVFGAGSAVAITPAQITALKDPSHASGLDLQAVSTRQQQMRAQGIGDDITTTVELYRGNKGKINPLQTDKENAKFFLINVKRDLDKVQKSKVKRKERRAKQNQIAQLQKTKSGLETQMQTMDAQLQGLKAIMEGQAEKIKATLGLTEAQIANIPAR